MYKTNTKFARLGGGGGVGATQSAFWMCNTVSWVIQNIIAMIIVLVVVYYVKNDTLENVWEWIIRKIRQSHYCNNDVKQCIYIYIDCGNLFLSEKV